MSNELNDPHVVGDNETLRSHIVDWLRANDINPNVIPVEPYMTLVGDQLTTSQKMQDANGWDQIDPNGTTVVLTTMTYTITVPPPPDVAEWLRPRCATCGR